MHYRLKPTKEAYLERLDEVRVDRNRQHFKKVTKAKSSHHVSQWLKTDIGTKSWWSLDMQNLT